MLDLTFVIKGDIAGLRLPSEVPSRFAEGLWRHTCFEVFIRCGGSPSYHEFNFSPSREWAVYAFERYRQASPIAHEALDPRIVVHSSHSTLTLEAEIALPRLSQMHVDGALSLGLSAVIEDNEAALSYWALAHPSDKPDFHHPDSFTLHLS
jgi:hypothetical protein